MSATPVLRCDLVRPGLTPQHTAPGRWHHKGSDDDGDQRRTRQKTADGNRRGRAGLVHRPRARDGRRARQPSRARGRCLLQRRRPLEGERCRLRRARVAGLRLLSGDARSGAGPAGRRADRLRDGRHAEPHALSRGEGGGRGRLPCRLRQAAHAHARRSRGSRKGGGGLEGRVRGHPQLHRLSACAAGSGDDPVGRTR